MLESSSSFFNPSATPMIYTLSLHDALPISVFSTAVSFAALFSAALLHAARPSATKPRSEEHTSELQSRENLVCRLLLEKKKCMEPRFGTSLLLLPSGLAGCSAFDVWIAVRL